MQNLLDRRLRLLLDHGLCPLIDRELCSLIDHELCSLIDKRFHFELPEQSRGQVCLGKHWQSVYSAARAQPRANPKNPRNP